MCVCLYVCVCMHVYVCACMHAYVRACICMCMCVCLATFGSKQLAFLRKQTNNNIIYTLHTKWHFCAYFLFYFDTINVSHILLPHIFLEALHILTRGRNESSNFLWCLTFLLYLQTLCCMLTGKVTQQI